MRLPPSVEALQATPYYQVRRHGISEKMWSAIQRACALAPRLEGLVGDLPALDAALMSIPGNGPWTSAHVRREAGGDPDAVPVGDYHLKNYVCYALAGEPRGDDARMLELLAPFAGQRGRVAELIMAVGPAAPKYGPRSPLRDPSVW
jgi:3-methyladenine DNA glycosylase/8-oxoguanine DNA glycosylase